MTVDSTSMRKNLVQLLQSARSGSSALDVFGQHDVVSGCLGHVLCTQFQNLDWLVLAVPYGMIDVFNNSYAIILSYTRI